MEGLCSGRQGKIEAEAAEPRNPLPAELVAHRCLLYLNPGRGQRWTFRRQRRVEVVEVAHQVPYEAMGRVEPVAAGEGDAAERRMLYRTGMRMTDVERATIEAALEETDGNRRRAAELLGIGERTLYRKLKEYDIDL